LIPQNVLKMVKTQVVKVNFISEAELIDRQTKYMGRLADVTNSGELVKRSEKEYYELQQERAHESHWEHYLRCDGLPRPYVPVDVRTFIAKMRHYDEIDIRASVSWTLGIEERSILNQDIFRIDKTRLKIIETMDDPGAHYARNLKMCQDTLVQMDLMFDNPVEMEKMSDKVHLEVIKVYNEVIEEITQIVERLSYRIIHMQGAYMKTADNKVATWSYRGSSWRLDLWGLLNVSVLFDQLAVPAMLADFEVTGVRVLIPLSMLGDCMTIRCIHTDFDNVSQKAKSFELSISPNMNFPNAGITDMQESVTAEWMTLQGIQEDTLNEMLRKRAEYEEIMKLIQEATEQAAKEEKSGDKDKPRTVIPKAPKEPIAVPPGMVPDVYNDFLNQEDMNYLDFIKELSSRCNILSIQIQINLRDYLIIGGVYSIMFVHRPDQTQYEQFNIILHEDGRKMKSMPELVVPDLMFNAHAREMHRKSRTMEKVPAEAAMDESELPYFNVTLQLPADLCRWSQPIVCQYISETQIIEEPLKPRPSQWFGAMAVMQENDSNTSLRRSSRFSTDSANIFRPSLRAMLFQPPAEPNTELITVKNFPLRKVLSKLEGRNLIKYTLPRMISTLKLPKDLIDTDFDAAAAGGGKKLFKRQENTDSAVKPVKATINYQNQLIVPERMYANFPELDSVQYDSQITDDDEPQELGIRFIHEETLHGLIRDLDSIKQKFLDKPNLLLGQQDEVDKKDKEREKERRERKEREEAEAALKKEEASKLKEEMIAKRKSKRLTKMTSEIVRPAVTTKEVDVTHWTTEYIHSSHLDPKTYKLSFATDRLGLIGLAFKRYAQFPFTDWYMQPSEENPDEILLLVDTFHVRIYFYISTKGVRGYVTDIIKGYSSKPVKYLEIKEPINDFRQLRKVSLTSEHSWISNVKVSQVFVAKNINIFAENDASYYIDNGYFSIKHVACEQHTHRLMALHCKTMKFYRSGWNRLASRRDLITGMKIAKDNTDYSECTLRIRPENATFVTITENCSDNEEIVVLSYTPTWRNFANFTDLHQAICSMIPNATELRNRDSTLLHLINRMLNEIRLFSFS
ncbi:hypothetical protein KR018_009166, partial [Drosophila ironensis]